MNKKGKDLKGKWAAKFIVLDGPDGCGKSTQAKLLAEWLGEPSPSEGLGEQELKVLTLRDPGWTAIGERRKKFSYINLSV